jgi:hypothetical protein
MLAVVPAVLGRPDAVLGHLSEKQMEINHAPLLVMLNKLTEGSSEKLNRAKLKKKSRVYNYILLRIGGSFDKESLFRLYSKYFVK